MDFHNSKNFINEDWFDIFNWENIFLNFSWDKFCFDQNGVFFLRNEDKFFVYLNSNFGGIKPDESGKDQNAEFKLPDRR